MTCLAMLKDKKGNFWFAGDRRMSWGMHKAIKSPKPKITKRNGVMLAGTGDAALCDLVVNHFPIPDVVYDKWVQGYMFDTFVPKLKEFLKANGRLDKDGETLSRGDASIVVGVEGKLFDLTLDESIICYVHVEAPYAAGCGGQLALGSLLTTEGTKMNIKDRLKLALRVAAKASPGCDGHIDILTNG